MSMPDARALPPTLTTLTAPLVADLQTIFGARLRAVVAHGPRVRSRAPVSADAPPIATLAITASLDYKDLVAAAQRTGAWRRAGLAVPLLLSERDFARSLDAFPIEYGDIIAHHVVLFGANPMVGLTVQAPDLRRACERWAKSHLIHLREGFVEAGGDARAVAELVVASAPPFAGLLALIARLRGHDDSGPEAIARATEGIADLPTGVLRDVVALEQRTALDNDTAMALYPPYLDAVEKLVVFLDAWSA